ncbi:hypothetical protein PFY06_17815 (plasmid) [Pseudoroseomonas cervicalis]|nr:hypothetical protein [Pseudoroseomonas cervicalis]WBV44964.1 hypothetical protein PFY06_17815 [Pseudoroseomonas cervicalis]
MAKARAITASKPRGRLSLSSEGATGSVCSTLCITAWKPPENAFSPVSSWYSTVPAAQMSARWSAGSPRSCSGAMELGVPSTVPSRVIAESSSREMPKSVILTRGDAASSASSSMMLAGLMSRCTTPRACE